MIRVKGWAVIAAVVMLCACGSHGNASEITRASSAGITTPVTQKQETGWDLNVSWSLSDEGTLLIEGDGDMPDMFGEAAPWEQYRERIKRVQIAEGVTSIGSAAFSGCKDLGEVIIPHSVKTIGRSAFYSCVSLEEIAVPDGVLLIADAAFWECSSLKKVTIGSSVKTIGYNAFCKCTSLESITLPDGLESIGDCAFEYCRNLTKISIPSSVTEIGGSAFSCTGGLTITAPEGSKAEEYAKKYGYSYCGSQINDTDRRVYYGLPYTPGQAGAGECHRGS